MIFTQEPFTAVDFQEFLDEDLSLEEKEAWCAGYLWWPIDTAFLQRYIDEVGNSPFKIVDNGETIGHFNVWDDDKCPPGKIRVSRGMIYKQFRGQMIDGNTYCNSLVQSMVAKAQELYPAKTPYAVVYDVSRNYSRRTTSKGLSCLLSAGFVEYDRKEIREPTYKNILAEKIWLEYQG